MNERRFSSAALLVSFSDGAIQIIGRCCGKIRRVASGFSPESIKNSVRMHPAREFAGVLPVVTSVGSV